MPNRNVYDTQMVAFANADTVYESGMKVRFKMKWSSAATNPTNLPLRFYNYSTTGAISSVKDYVSYTFANQGEWETVEFDLDFFLNEEGKFLGFRLVFFGSENETLSFDLVEIYKPDTTVYGTFTYGNALNFQIQKTGELAITSEYFDFSGEVAEQTWSAEDFGLETFLSTRFNLKIVMKNINANRTSAKIGIWINNIMLGNDYFTITASSESGIIENKIGRTYITSYASSLDMPEAYEVLTWEDFGVTCGVEYTYLATDSAPVRSATHLTSLNNTMFDGDVVMAANSEMRYGGSDRWKGIQIQVNSDGKFIVLSQTFTMNVEDSSIYTLSDATAYGLKSTSFAGEKFNLKIAMTNVTDTFATVTVWINDKIVGETFSMTAMSTNTLGTRMDLPTNSGGSITPYTSLSEAPSGLTDMRLSDWVSTVYDDGKLTHGEVYSCATSKVSTLVGTSFEETFQFIGTPDSTLTNYAIMYGGMQGENMTWYGLHLAFSGENLVLYDNSDSTFTDKWTLDAKKAGVAAFLNTEYQLRIDTVKRNQHILLYLYFDGNLYNDAPFVLSNFADKMSNTLVFRMIPNNEATYAILGPSKKTLEDLYHDLAKGNYVIPSGMTEISQMSIVDGVETWNALNVTEGSELSAVGDYEVTYNDGVSSYTQKVILYQAGDVSAAELVRALKHTKDQVDKTYEKHQIRLCDVDYNDVIDDADVETIREMLLGTYKAEMASDVMPIGAFRGPITGLINDNTYKLLHDAGINLIVYNENKYTDVAIDRYYVYQQMTLAQKYGLGNMVWDNRLWSNASTVTTTDVQNAIANYKDYQSFYGLHILDEIDTDAYITSELETAKQLETYTAFADAADSLGLFTYKNMYMYSQAWGNSEQAGYDYVNYARDVVDKLHAEALTATCYPFRYRYKENDWAGYGVDDASSYFTNLAMLRSVSKEKNVPFWTFVQTGEGFDFDSFGELGLPTEGMLNWNVNTALAFGAKGIQYFPAVQPSYFYDLDDGSCASGLIDDSGNKTQWYDYAVDVNAQIAAIDEVLMNATHEGLMASGSSTAYARTQATEVVDSIDLKQEKLWGLYYETVETLEMEIFSESNKYNGALVSSSDSDTYGTLTGCFAYGDKHALYIVNYNPNESNTIQITFDSDVTATTIHNAVNQTYEGNSISMELGAGEAVLVVY